MTGGYLTARPAIPVYGVRLEFGVHERDRRDHGAALDLHRPEYRLQSPVSFQVVIMALFGGVGRLYGPALGAVPLVLLSARRFPYHFSIALGICFIVIVYL